MSPWIPMASLRQIHGKRWCCHFIQQRSAKAKPVIDLCSYSSQVKVRTGKVSWEESPGAGWTSRDLDDWLLGEGMNEWLVLDQVVLLQSTTEGQMPVYYSCFPLSNQMSKSPWPASCQTTGNLLCRTPRKPYFNQGCNQGDHPISHQGCHFAQKLLSLSDSTCSSAFTGGSGPWSHECSPIPFIEAPFNSAGKPLHPFSSGEGKKGIRNHLGFLRDCVRASKREREGGNWSTGLIT